MVRSFEFESVGGEDARLRARSPDGRTVTLTAGWFGEDAEWRRIHAHVLGAGVPHAISVDGAAKSVDGAASVPAENAIVAIRDGEDISSDEAEALLAYLDAEGAVALSEGGVSVLFDPAPADPLSAERWVVARDALAAELDRLDDRLFDGPTPREQAEEKLEATAEEIRDLLPDDDPSDIEALSSDERQRLEELRKRYHYFEQLRETNVDPLLAPGPADWAERLRAATATPPDALARFEAAVEALATLRDEDTDLHSCADELDRLRESVEALTEA